MANGVLFYVYGLLFALLLTITGGMLLVSPTTYLRFGFRVGKFMRIARPDLEVNVKPGLHMGFVVPGLAALALGFLLIWHNLSALLSMRMVNWLGLTFAGVLITSGVLLMAKPRLLYSWVKILVPYVVVTEKGSFVQNEGLVRGFGALLSMVGLCALVLSL